MGKDYYAILGVTQFAEDIVIRAAYKALAQRYHPDRFQGSVEEANRRMAEINEAYAVLGDPKKRKEYDAQYAKGIHDGEPYFGDKDADSPPGSDPLAKDWELAAEYFPDLRDTEQKLKQISWKLSYLFKAYLLETKDFKNRLTVAQKFERQFLQCYFGTNPLIIQFAQRLIAKGLRSAALELNEAVRVLGNDVDPRTIIGKIRNRYSKHLQMDDVEVLIDKIRNAGNYSTTPHKIKLVKALGGSFKWSIVPFSEQCSVELDGQRYDFKNVRQFGAWVRDTLIPSLLSGQINR